MKKIVSSVLVIQGLSLILLLTLRLWAERADRKDWVRVLAQRK